MEEFMFQDSTNKAKVIKFLMKEKKHGKLPGFCGRLGDLGEKYNVPISAFALNCIVVDTIYTAAKCIDLLHENNVGRASFIALDAHEFCSTEGGTGTNTNYPDGVSQLFEIIRLEMKNAPQEKVDQGTGSTPGKKKVLQMMNDQGTSSTPRKKKDLQMMNDQGTGSTPTKKKVLQMMNDQGTGSSTPRKKKDLQMMNDQGTGSTPTKKKVLQMMNDQGTGSTPRKKKDLMVNDQGTGSTPGKKKVLQMMNDQGTVSTPTKKKVLQMMNTAASTKMVQE